MSDRAERPSAHLLGIPYLLGYLALLNLHRYDQGLPCECNRRYRPDVDQPGFGPYRRLASYPQLDAAYLHAGGVRDALLPPRRCEDHV